MTDLAELLHECRRREHEAREQAADSARYAAWQRSPEGQAHQDAWVGGGPEDGDRDVAFYTRDAAFYTAMQQALAVVDAARVLLVTLPNQHFTAEWHALRESVAAMELT